MRPLEFEPIIVLLTGIHFHYAGFVLPIVSGLCARRVGGRLGTATWIIVIAAVPLVATGITASQLGAPPVFECAAAWLMASGGLGTAVLLLRCAAGDHAANSALWRVAAIFLSFGMVLAALYGTRAYIHVSGLDIPWMRALHGTSNAVGFALPALVAFVVARDGGNPDHSSAA